MGLALWFLKKRDPVYNLCPIFGVVPTTPEVWFDYAMQVILQIVRKPSYSDFAIKWPSPHEMDESAELLRNNRENGRFLQGVFAVVDGGKMPCAKYCEATFRIATGKVVRKAMKSLTSSR